MEDLILTDDERAVLQELEKRWYVGISNTIFNSRQVSSQEVPETPPRQPSHVEEENPAKTTRLLETEEERRNVGQSAPPEAPWSPLSQTHPPSHIMMPGQTANQLTAKPSSRITDAVSQPPTHSYDSPPKATNVSQSIDEKSNIQRSPSITPPASQSLDAAQAKAPKSHSVSQSPITISARSVSQDDSPTHHYYSQEVSQLVSSQSPSGSKKSSQSPIPSQDRDPIGAPVSQPTSSPTSHRVSQSPGASSHSSSTSRKASQSPILSPRRASTRSQVNQSAPITSGRASTSSTASQSTFTTLVSQPPHPTRARTPVSSKTSTETKQAKRKLRSCSKTKQWTELERDEYDHLVMRKVIDLGQQMSSRKRTEKESGRVKLEEENKHKNKLEAEKEETAKPLRTQTMTQKRSRFETQTKPTKSEDDCLSKNKHKLESEVEKSRKMKSQKWLYALPDLGDSAHRKKPSKQKPPITITLSKNKQEENTEAVKARHNSKNKPFQVNKTKMTSPTKVKTDACRKQMLKSDSPKLFVRMKPPKRANHAAMLKLVKPDTRCSPVKKSKFNLLLQSWENSSNKTLTPAVSKLPRLSPETGSQSQKSLERKICNGVSSEKTWK
jgi:hypothetical protein